MSERSVDEGLAVIEREMINRGYRILYRRPDDHFLVTYQLSKDGSTMGFRMTEQFAAQCNNPAALVDRLEREWNGGPTMSYITTKGLR